MMAGGCIEFDYLPDGAEVPSVRKIVPYGLIHGPITYLIGNILGRVDDPIIFRLDRMSHPQIADQQGVPPESWDLDTWMAQSFGIWRENDYEIVLRVLPNAVDRAATWRFHPSQTIEEVGKELIVRFRAGGLWEIADHVFTWGGDVVIEGPGELRDVMRERLEASALSLRPILT
jgi:proteasome accessory factor B